MVEGLIPGGFLVQLYCIGNVMQEYYVCWFLQGYNFTEQKPLPVPLLQKNRVEEIYKKFFFKESVIQSDSIAARVNTSEKEGFGPP
jgi:hypothetical protein